MNIHEATLRKKLGLSATQCINSNQGATDILEVTETHVTLGLVATGRSFSITQEELLKKIALLTRED